MFHRGKTHVKMTLYFKKKSKSDLTALLCMHELLLPDLSPTPLGGSAVSGFSAISGGSVVSGGVGSIVLSFLVVPGGSVFLGGIVVSVGGGPVVRKKRFSVSSGKGLEKLSQ